MRYGNGARLATYLVHLVVRVLSAVRQLPNHIMQIMQRAGR